MVLASKIQLNAIIINKIKEPLLKEDFFLNNNEQDIENDAEYSSILVLYILKNSHKNLFLGKR